MRYTGFAELLSNGCKRFPSKPALIFDVCGTTQTITYNELYKSVLARRDELSSLPTECLGLYAHVTPEWIITMFASVLAGKRTVLLDYSQSTETARELIMHAEVDSLYTDDVEEDAKLSPFLCPVHTVDHGNEEGKLLFFTSGTMQASKAVVLTSRALCSSAWNGQQMLPCGEDDTVLCMLPLNHVFGFVCCMLWPLSQGAAVALGRGMRFFTSDPIHFKPTILPAVPSLIKYLFAMHSLNSELTTVLIGASPCDSATLSGVRSTGVDVRFGYGLTETASGLAISKAGDDPFAMSLCPDTKLRLSEDGEILVRTSCMMEGYYNDEETTASVLNNGELSTGDIGFLDPQGRLRITGRKKDVLILDNGTKVFCSEWEQQLSALIGCEVAITLKNGRIVLIVSAAETQRDELWEKVRWFNGTQTFDRQISDMLLRDEPLPHTSVGKLKRWAL